MTYYPVIIPTLNRYEHFKRCVESLAQNTHADKTELIIGLDYPPAEKYKEGYEKIKKYLPTITGFKKVIVFERDENYGAEKNWNSLANYVFKEYDALISTEDDNEFSPCFLDFMNKALDIYRYNDNVRSVCGWVAPCFQKINRGSLIFTKSNAAWGYGCWKYKMPLPDDQYFRKSLFKFTTSLKLFMVSPAGWDILRYMILQGKSWGDVKCGSYNYLNKTYQLRPSVSLVRNTGNDGTGEHCSDDGGKMAAQIISTSQTYDFDYLNPHMSLKTRVAQFYHNIYTKGIIKKNMVVLLLFYRFIVFHLNKKKYGVIS